LFPLMESEDNEIYPSTTTRDFHYV
jgi:hypothetical protein